MRRLFRWPGWACCPLLLLLALSCGARAQLSFATASIREVDPKGPPPETNVDTDGSDYFRYLGGPVVIGDDLTSLILFAYHWADDESSSDALHKQLPAWARDATYLVRATVDEAGRPITKDEIRESMKTLLAERFGLKVHPETREKTAWVMTVDPKPHTTPGLVPRGDMDICAHPAKADEANKAARKTNPKFLPVTCTILFTNDSPTVIQLNVDGRTMTTLTQTIVWTGSTVGGMDSLPIIDQTGVKGYFDLHVKFQRVKNGLPVPEADGEKPAPRFVDALRQQAGLVLTRQKTAVPVLVVDHVEKPSPD